MPTFMLSLNWTDQGIRGVKDAPKRSQAASSSKSLHHSVSLTNEESRTP